MKKICKCEGPYYYAPIYKNGHCRFCWGYILTIKELYKRELGIKLIHK